MKTLLKKYFFENWQRKGFSLFIAIVTWCVINHSLTSNKTISNVPIKVVNLPSNKTVIGMQENGVMEKTVSLTLVGNKTALDRLNPNALEIVVDASDKPDVWVESIAKKHLVALNGDVDLGKGISQISPLNVTFRSIKLVTEKIPIVITQPIGDAPRGYQFLDVWPYHMTLTVKGPEDVVTMLKSKEHRLTFNLNDINKSDLDTIQTRENGAKKEVISFPVPVHWKQIEIPSLSNTPLQIDDPDANQLRIDFVRYDLLPLESTLPVTLFFPHEHLSHLNPITCSLEQSGLLKNENGINILNERLYAKGVSRLFLEVVKDMMQLQIVVSPNADHGNRLSWSVQFVNPRNLENEYVARLKTEFSDEDSKIFQPVLKEIYWRNRFRSYMSRFELFKEDGSKLDLNVQLDSHAIIIAKADS